MYTPFILNQGYHLKKRLVWLNLINKTWINKKTRLLNLTTHIIWNSLYNLLTTKAASPFVLVFSCILNFQNDFKWCYVQSHTKTLIILNLFYLSMFFTIIMTGINASHSSAGKALVPWNYFFDATCQRAKNGAVTSFSCQWSPQFCHFTCVSATGPVLAFWASRWRNVIGQS